jgi:hypothetical protein
MLVERGLIEPDQVETALREQVHTGEPIGTVLVSLGFIEEQTLRNVLLEQCGLDLTRQEGFGSGLLSELERRRGARPAAVEPRPAPVEQQPVATVTEDPAVGWARVDESEPVVGWARVDEPEPQHEEPEPRKGVLERPREAVTASFDALLETFEERSRALSAELAAMRRLLHDIAG